MRIFKVECEFFGVVESKLATKFVVFIIIFPPFPLNLFKTNVTTIENATKHIKHEYESECWKIEKENRAGNARL